MRLTLARPFEPLTAVLLALVAYGLLLNDGANTVLGGATLATVGALLLLGLVVFARWARRALEHGPGLRLPAFAFAATLAVAAWTMTPWLPGGAHPAWSYVGGLGASTLDRASTFIEILKLLGGACMLLVGYAAGRSDDRARMLLKALLWMGGAYGLWSILRFVEIRDTGLARLTASFQSANTAATLFGLLTASALGVATSEGRPRSSRFDWRDLAPAGPYWALILIFAVCIFLTASRGGAVAAAAGLIVFLGLEAWAGRFHLRMGAAAMLAAGAMLLLQGSLLLDRVAGGAGDRQPMFAVYWRVFQDSPLFGYGLGTFDAVNKLQLSATTYEALWATRAAHNVYLQWLLEGGLIGAAPMFACVGLLIAMTWRGMGQRKRSTTLIRGLLAADAVVLVHGATDFALQVPGFMMLFALVLGLQLGMAYGSSQARV